MEVEILGKLTRVNCPPGQEEALHAAASELNQRLKQMTERTKVHNIEQLLTIAALNACYEVKALQKEMSDNEHLTQRIAHLNEALDKALDRK
ncbi:MULTISPECIES: cell division protein ZapA [Vibrio]|uniref:Cell division protein ZapA n=1 Tax=Vibrio casei TaxID=673372 RepID=A0A368LPK7_9VIBR|nr:MULTISPECIES: cell division protein ZapA [Vibrio]RCS73812.1 cell division protein ZapA [Vibrio casei]SJN35163.1 Z-ring-associated protein ZapA [Vibrio casei]HBV77287.1 cell division protein ZapA [Vibrio sp.]